MDNRIVWKKGIKKSTTEQSLYLALQESPLNVKLDERFPALMVVDYDWSRGQWTNRIELVSMLKGQLQIEELPSDCRYIEEKTTFRTFPSVQTSVVPRKDPIVRQKTPVHLVSVPACYLPQLFTPTNLKHKLLYLKIYQHPVFVRIFEPNPEERSKIGHLQGYLIR